MHKTTIIYTLRQQQQKNNKKQNKKKNGAPRRSCPIATKIDGYQEQTLKNKRLKFSNN